MPAMAKVGIGSDAPQLKPRRTGASTFLVDAGMVILVFFFVFSFILDPVELPELYSLDSQQTRILFIFM